MVSCYRFHPEGCRGAGERLLRRTRCINPCPAENAKIILLLSARDCRVGVGSIATASSDASEPHREVGFEKEAVEGHAERRCASLDCVALLRFGIDRIDDRRVASPD